VGSVVLTSLTLQFTPAAGISTGTSQITTDLKQSATVFQSTTLIQTIAAISMTVSNERGTSNSLQVTLP
jgi:hypothetical protein